MLRGLRFFELFRRSRRFEERLSALQSSFDRGEHQSGGTQQTAPRQPHPDDARVELLIGLNDNLDEMRQGDRPRRFAGITAGAFGLFILLNSPDLREAVLGGLILVVMLVGGWVELRRFRRVRMLQRVIERELSRPQPKASLPQSTHGTSGETS